MSGLHAVPPDQPINRQGVGRRRIGPGALLSDKNATHVGTRYVIGPGSALSMASWWWQRWRDTATDRTPLARMLPSVIGSPWDRGRVLMPWRIPRWRGDRNIGGFDRDLDQSASYLKRRKLQTAVRLS
jgi:hypothetical protein